MSHHMPSDSRTGGSIGAMGRAAGDEKLRQEGRLLAFSSPLALVHYINSLLYPIQYRFVAQWSPTFFISRRTIELLKYLGHIYHKTRMFSTIELFCHKIIKSKEDQHTPYLVTDIE